MDWRDFLDGWHPRGDVYEDFPPRHLDDLKPALLNETGLLNAAAVAARVLQIVAQRGGTRLDSAAFNELLNRVQDVLPDSATNHCDEEAARILQWLEAAEKVDDEDLTDSGLPPELDVMMASEIESRVSVAQFAIRDDYDLELEYFDEARQVWPRMYCTPVSLLGLDQARSEDSEETAIEESAENEEAADDEDEADKDESDRGTADSELSDVELVVEHAGRTRHLPIRTIRWLMPVSPRPSAAGPNAPKEVDNEPAEVVDFPGLEDRQSDQDERDN
jgi:hypothetical protein